jgi:hypothetical protein
MRNRTRQSSRKARTPIPVVVDLADGPRPRLYEASSRPVPTFQVLHRAAPIGLFGPGISRSPSYGAHQERLGCIADRIQHHSPFPIRRLTETEFSAAPSRMAPARKRTRGMDARAASQSQLWRIS